MAQHHVDAAEEGDAGKARIGLVDALLTVQRARLQLIEIVKELLTDTHAALRHQGDVADLVAPMGPRRIFILVSCMVLDLYDQVGAIPDRGGIRIKEEIVFRKAPIAVVAEILGHALAFLLERLLGQRVAAMQREVADITSHTPVVCNVVPNGDISCINLYKAGGVPAVLKTIEGDLDTSAMTVTGRTLGENLDRDVPVDRSVIRTQDDPDSVCNGIQVLYGNLAPEGALVKTSAVPAEQHVWTGKAQVFESEEEAFAAYNAHAIKPGTGVVVRYEGPKGGPGMKELHRVTEIMKGIPNSAVITDGRFSGASGGLSVGYLCPEALDGAPIALIQDGDLLHVDLTRNLIEVDVSEEEFARRKQSWKPVIHENGGHLLARYAEQVGSAKTGAIIG